MASATRWGYSFCAGTVCTITRLCDQSGHGNGHMDAQWDIKP